MNIRTPARSESLNDDLDLESWIQSRIGRLSRIGESYEDAGEGIRIDSRELGAEVNDECVLESADFNRCHLALPSAIAPRSR
jgi:hypothetical protein